jgi:hypothetical protein
VLAACADDDRPERRAQPAQPDDAPAAGDDAPGVGDAGPIHIHGLGRNPADGALFIATHTGLFRQPRPGVRPTRVADRFQDTMAFTVVGANRFLASGHPDGRENLPPFLGLIESTDAGRTWTPVSLQGEMDFHVLEAAGRRVYGFGSDWKTRREQLLVSDDAGRSWQGRSAPEPLISLALDPRDADRAAAAGQGGLHLTVDGARRWRKLRHPTGLLAWTARGLYSVDRDGVVRLAPHDLRWAETIGHVGGEPAAFDNGSARELYVALHDGTIKRSLDGGRSWHRGNRSRDRGNPSRPTDRDRTHHARGDSARPHAQRSRPPSEAFRERCAALQDLRCGREAAPLEK